LCDATIYNAQPGGRSRRRDTVHTHSSCITAGLPLVCSRGMPKGMQLGTRTGWSFLAHLLVSSPSAIDLTVCLRRCP